MTVFTSQSGGVFYSGGGVTIDAAISEALLRARSRPRFVFDHSGVVVVVAKDSNPELLRRDWARARDGLLGDHDDVTVGPYPKAELSDEEKARDQEIMETKAKLRRLLDDAARRYAS